MRTANGTNVIFTPALLVEFKSAYQTAITEKRSQFTWNGYEWLVAYAKYVIEYLTGRFSEGKGGYIGLLS